MAPWKDEDYKGQETPFEYVFDIHSSRADYTDYNQGKTALLVLEGERENLDGKREEHHIWLSAGKFEPSPDKTRLIHESGDLEKRFDPQSKVQKFIGSAVDAGVPLTERGECAMDATMWAGLRLRIKEERKSSKIDGEDREWRQPLVIEYLGTLDGGQAGGAAAGSGTDDELLELAKKVKAEGKDHLDFMEQASAQFGYNLDAPQLAESGVWSKA